MRRLSHRGPDAEGIHVGRGGVLGHRRLSIMDPAGGDQPILSEDRLRAVVANGEIYNYPDLHGPLEAGGHVLATGNDSEAALHLYEDLAGATAERLDGMFAFAISDGEDLYVARDALGIKPLYVGRDGADLVFASELKALADLADDVREFPPGSWYHTRLGLRRFRELPDREPLELPVEEHCGRIRRTLERAVVKRLMSDVPVGAFLSGGLDSSLIAAIARRHVRQLHTFSVGIEGSRDLAAARVVSRHLDTVHHEYAFTVEEVRQHLPEIIYHLESFDQDLVRSAIPCYYTSRLACDHVKVILTGEGADELFAGYTYYREMAGGASLHRELRRSVASLHNINLQRVDRLTMAHAIEGRVPFLDLEMIEVAQAVPPSLKLRRGPDGQQVEKWILRKACEGLLPAEILWRPKEQFDEGSGTVDVLSRALEAFGPPSSDPQSGCPEGIRIRSAEERAYYDLLIGAYEKPAMVVGNVARWSFRGGDLDEPAAHPCFEGMR